MYAVLLSAASEMVYPDLVCTPRFTSHVEADAFGAAIVTASPGLEFEVLEAVGSSWDRNPREVLRLWS